MCATLQPATPRVTGLVEEARALLAHVQNTEHADAAAERAASSPQLALTPPRPSPSAASQSQRNLSPGSASSATAGRWHGWASKPLG